jgi:HK97 family phage prohead protease
MSVSLSLPVGTRAVDALLVGKRAANGQKLYTFRASTANVARDGFRIPPEAWSLGPFKKNPAVLIGHNYGSLPIGKSTRVWTDSAGLMAEVQFDSFDPVAQLVEKKIDSGSLSAVSVGFRAESGIDYPEGPNKPGVARYPTTLLEVSVVAVPADEDALVMRSQLERRGLRVVSRRRPDPAREALLLVKELKTMSQPRRYRQPDPAREALRLIRELRRQAVRGSYR